MITNKFFFGCVAAVAFGSALAGCVKPAGTAPATAMEAAPPPASAASPEGGIPIPGAVRDNLGITFAKVELRAVAETRRIPGQFELPPTARQEYRAPLAGRITLHVAQFDAVEAGALLFTIDSPQWRQIQHEAVEAAGDIAMAQAALAVAQAQRNEAQSSLNKQEERLGNLAAVNVRNAELEAAATALRSSLPRLDAENRAQQTALLEAEEHFASRLNALSSVTGIPVDALRSGAGDAAAWRSLAALEVRAHQAGVVEKLEVAPGGWLEEGVLAMTLVDPAQVRFRAEAPQADILLFRDGMAARVVPPRGGSVDLQAALPGTLALGITADAEDRTLPLYVTPAELAPWAKEGVGGYLEIELTEDPRKQFAIPLASVMQDGLEHVFYRRDPADPDRALRVLADLGPSDGRWVVLKSGVKEGDEVVLDGAYALKLTSSGQQAPSGYHYHADGQLHKNH
ncbi:MAG: HlyD family efflux transporter periplasmic adaptor subunit [Candidatus Hydrogenedens sp.]|nr:HlyD family efflux transporter periplasmic adaptor subunit [Candidatus Hydrogenedens sp.]